MKRIWLAALVVLAGCGSGHQASPTLKEPNAGDEHGISVAVHIKVSAHAVRVTPRTVAAFLPLRFTVVGAQAVQLRGRSIGTAATSPGLKAGRYPIRAGNGRHTTLVVKSGG